MKARSTLSIILAASLIVALAVAGWFAWLHYQSDNQKPADQTSPTQVEDETNNQPPMDSPKSSTSYTTEGGTQITVTQPLSGSSVSSPLAVTGTVPGSWSFEASFPVRLLDASRQEITTGSAHLNGNWMTDQQVPFTAQLEFSAPATNSGYLILEKSNPSDLPENADQLELPVRFN